MYKDITDLSIILYLPSSPCDHPEAVTPSLFTSFPSPCLRVAQKREDAVSKEVTRKLSEADNRKMSRKEKDER